MNLLTSGTNVMIVINHQNVIAKECQCKKPQCNNGVLNDIYTNNVYILNELFYQMKMQSKK